MKADLVAPLLAIGLLLAQAHPLVAVAPDSAKVHALYNSLKPCALAEHLAFYRLYPDTPEGKLALEAAWRLMTGEVASDAAVVGRQMLASRSGVEAMVALVTREPSQPLPELSDEDIAAIDAVSVRLGNRRLKGFHAMTEREVLALPPDEIDMARGLLISQLGNSPDSLKKVQQYEAMLDLMALQVLACLPKEAGPKQKIAALNTFIFEEMHFRFPPHSLYVGQIDTYTFLPSVLDSHEGVCLGVSLLYLSLGQRIDLPLEIITPPGHIFVRWVEGDEVINIETTARGVHLPTEVYLGVNTPCLQRRDIKQAIGEAHFNEASVWWQQGDYDRAVACYEKARLYVGDDLLLLELLGFNLVFAGRIEEGRALLERIKGQVRPDSTSVDTMPIDYLEGKVDAEGLKAIFLHVDERRESILAKQKTLEAVVARCPEFREGWLQLAVTWLQLQRMREAVPLLSRCYSLDSSNPVVAYYLALLHAMRSDYNKAWGYLRRSEELVAPYHHDPEALQQLRHALRLRSAEP